MADAIPTLEALMEKLEKMGREKQASAMHGVISMLQLEPFKFKERTRHSRGTLPGEVYTLDPSRKMLQEGEEYTEIDPTTKGETVKRYRMRKPLEVSQLEPYFDKGMFVVDFFREQAAREKDPVKKAVVQRLLDKAVKQEEALRTKEAYAGEKRHWLAMPSAEMPRRQDPTEAFLSMEMKSAPEESRPVIAELLDKYRSRKSPGRAALVRCAAALKGKGYDALAVRLIDKAAAGVHRMGESVRVWSMAEHIGRSKPKGGADDSFYDRMFDMYVAALGEAASAVRKAKVELHDPKGIKDAMTTVFKADDLMMKGLRKIGEPVGEPAPAAGATHTRRAG